MLIREDFFGVAEKYPVSITNVFTPIIENPARRYTPKDTS
jgi:hypothetical protein